MDCREVKELLSAYLDKVLEVKEEQKVREHLKNCQSCQEELATLKVAINFLKNGEEIAPPADFRLNLRAKLEAEKSNETPTTTINFANKLKKHWSKFSAVAVLLLLLVGVLPSLTEKKQIELAQDAPKEAMESLNTTISDQEIGATDMSQVESFSSNNESLQGSVAQKESQMLNKTTKDVAEAPKHKVIINGAVGLEVISISEASEEITEIVEAQGGFIQKSSFTEKEEGKATLVLRVPSEGFQEVLDEVLKLGQLKFKETDGQDATEEYSDIEARIVTLKTQEERLLALIDAGENLEEILKIEQELQRVREDIEKLKGRLKTISESAGLATLNVELYQNSSVPTAGLMTNSVLSDLQYIEAISYLLLLVLAGSGYYWVKRRYFNSKR